MATKKSKAFEFKPFSPKQRQLIHWWRDKCPHSDCDMIIADGAIRSGKTIACICSFLIWSLEVFDGQNFILAGKTIGSLKKNVIGPMLQVLTAWGIPYHYVRSGENYIEIGANTYYLYDANNEASQDRLQGLTAAGAYADEAALFSRNFIEQMIGRCSVEGSKVYMNCNPAAPSHYLNVDYIKRAKEMHIYHLHFTMDDNLTLSPKTKDKYRRMFTGVFYKRFILGEWAATDGLIYQQFADEKERYLIDVPPDDIMYTVIGLDFGGSKSAHAITLTGFTAGFKRVVILDEYYHNNVKDGRLSPTQLEAAFVDFVRRAKSKYKVYEAFCDSAEQTLIEGLTVAAIRARLGIEVQNAVKGPINDRIAFYNSLIAQDRFKVMRHCTAHIKALEEAVYDDSKPVKDIRLDDGTTDIDSLDSMEYSTETVQEDILYLGVM
ncbi:MAG: PBSX family phage terminase large subunit [Eubacteriales bacterium]|nr:PBSX family phage terminase large subunit [Eubacteriales bacterium]